MGAYYVYFARARCHFLAGIRQNVPHSFTVRISLARMALTPLTLRVLGAAWFAAIAGIGFPLSMAAFPGPSTPSAQQFLSGVLGGVAMFGIPAAIAGAIFGPRIYRANPLGAFLFGVPVVLLTSLMAGFWMAAYNARFFNLRVIAEDGLAVGLGMILIDLILLRGVPLLLGGFAALGFRAVLFKLYAINDGR